MLTSLTSLPTPTPAPAPGRWRRLALGALVVVLTGAGAPAAAAVLVVTSAGDAGDVDPGNGTCAGPDGCTLRAAIEEANALPNDGAPDAVHFDIAGVGPHTLQPSSPLPAIVDAIVIDGYTQAGARPNALAEGTDAALMIELDGSASSPGDGLVLDTQTSVVRGLVVNGWRRLAAGSGGHAIVLRGAGGHVLEGNFLGTDPTGTIALPNFESGILIDDSDANLIGGAHPAARNLVSGNLVFGIDVTGAGNRLEGNVVGLDAGGRAALANERGVRIDGPGTVIGGTTPGAGNVVSGNAQHGVNVLAAGDGTEVLGNRIGTDVTGRIDVGNGGVGVRVSSGATDVRVGTAVPGGGNVIAGNGAHGVQLAGADFAVVQHNAIGTDTTGTRRLGNAGAGVLVDADEVTVGGAGPNHIAFNGSDGIQVFSSANQRNFFFANAIYANAGLGIDLSNDGVTPNDELDQDIGPNGRQNHPVLFTATSDGISTTIEGELHSTPDASFQIDFYANTACDPSGYGEGEEFRGTAVVATDAAGTGTFSAVLPVPVLGGSIITATATAPDRATSEFSPCITASGPLFTTTTSSIPTTTITATTTTSITATSTSTTTPGGSSTTTSTVPIPCTADPECEDGDACTADACVAGFCARRLLTDIPGVVCHADNLRVALTEVGCTPGCRCPFDRRIRRVTNRYDRAMEATRARRCRRLAVRARRPTRRLHRLVTRRHRDQCLVPGAAADRAAAESAALNLAAETLNVRDACRR